MKQYVVDAFADKVFEGNPAAVCIMDEWIPEDLMLNIAKENNLSETAFAVKEADFYRLRWFTPGGEVDLCGHATLATSFVLMNFVEQELTQVVFMTQSGRLTVVRKGDLYEMDFPSYPLTEVPVTDAMEDAIGTRPVKAYMGRDLLCIMATPEEVIKAKVQPDKVLGLDGMLLHITAEGLDYDCVSRSYAPKLNIPEDPVCGSGHCHIIPYWAQVSGKKDLTAFQASERSGVLYCNASGDRVRLAGKAVLFAESKLMLQ